MKTLILPLTWAAQITEDGYFCDLPKDDLTRITRITLSWSNIATPGAGWQILAKSEGAVDEIVGFLSMGTAGEPPFKWADSAIILWAEKQQNSEVLLDLSAFPDHGDGGDVNVIPGTGYKGSKDQAPGRDGRIQFFAADDSTEPMLSLGSDGVITVRGERVDDNPAVYRAFRAWMAAAGILFEDGEGDGGPATFTPAEEVDDVR